ncbi:PQQ-binding-like beta-propeller repeat protein [Marinitoga sp. 1137]|uniref:outer membrane protein assembly factor BamB family protein n=1 Tax=Marinitoga sp. 1137 TaxID=1545835 RepID=UPI00095113C9|nr:PQQ-binding-like beta-propeller repeat protein [Marinitoga sp. 1137]
MKRLYKIVWLGMILILLAGCFLRNTAPLKPYEPFPANNSTNVATEITLKWNCQDSDNDKLLYNVYLSESNGNLTPVEVDYPKTEIKYTNLHPDTLYKWKVVAKDNRGGITEGPIWYFKTISEKEKENDVYKNLEIVFLTPENGQTISQTDEATLEWKMNKDDFKVKEYSIYFGDNPIPPLVKEHYKEKYFYLSHLKSGKRYYWKIISYGEDGGFVESKTQYFYTKQVEIPGNHSPAIDLISPENNITLESTNTVKIIWDSKDPDNDKLTYNVYFGDFPLPSLIKVDYDSTSLIISDLKENKKYYWRIQVKDSRGALTESDTYYFIIEHSGDNPENTDPAIDIISPLNSETLISTDTVVLEWKGSDIDGDQIKYDVYFGDISSPPLIESGYEKTTITIPNLEEDKIYYWRVIAKDNNDGETDSGVYKFKTNKEMEENNHIPVVTKESPDDGEEYSYETTEIELKWEISDEDGDEVKSDIYYGEQKNPPLVQVSSESTGYIIPVERGKTYYWKIRVNDGRGGISETGISSVTVAEKPNNVPSISIVNPMNNETVESTDTVVLVWNGLDIDGDQIKYDIYFGDISSPPLVESSYESTTITISNLEEDKTYYWKVIANDGNRGETESEIYKFKTNSPPEDPVLTSPDNLEKVYENSVILNWNEVVDKDNDTVVYDLYTSTVSTNTLAITASDLTTNSYTISLTTDVLYWQIVAKDEHGAKSFSEIYTIRHIVPGTLKFKIDTGGNYIAANPVIDDEGNIYITYSSSSTENTKTYVSKYNSNGNLEWNTMLVYFVVQGSMIDDFLAGYSLMKGYDGNIYTTLRGNGSSMVAIDSDLGFVKWSIPDIASNLFPYFTSIEDGNLYFIGKDETAGNLIDATLFVTYESGSCSTTTINANTSDVSGIISAKIEGVDYLFIPFGGSNPGVIKLDAYFGEKTTEGFKAAYGVIYSNYNNENYLITSFTTGDDYSIAYYNIDTEFSTNTIMSDPPSSVGFNPGMPVVGSDGTIYAVYYDKLYAVNPDLTEKWSITLPNGDHIFSRSPAVGSDGTIYVLTDTKLYAFNPGDGSEKWVFTLDSGDYTYFQSPIISNDGTIYFSTYNGYIYAIYDNITGPDSSSWPMIGKNSMGVY